MIEVMLGSWRLRTFVFSLDVVSSDVDADVDVDGELRDVILGVGVRVCERSKCAKIGLHGMALRVREMNLPCARVQSRLCHVTCRPVSC